MISCRPLRALALVLAVWIGGRCAAWIIDAGGAVAARGQAPPALALGVPRPARVMQMALSKPPDRLPRLTHTHAALQASMPRRGVRLTEALHPARMRVGAPRLAPPAAADADDARVRVATLTAQAVPHLDVQASDADTSPSAHDVLAPAASQRRHALRLNGGSWSLVRGAAPVGLGDRGALGGSQAGVRISAPLREDGRISLTMRVSAPLSGQPGAEAAAGVALKPLPDVPVTLIVERRVAIDRGGRNDFAALVTTGVSDRALTHHLTLNGYVQAGVVGHDGFIDGAVSIAHDVVARGATRLTMGGGAWGAAQPGVARLDAGPELGLATHIGRVGLRVLASYRVRVAGHAAPPTGPAFSFGTSF